MCVCAASRRGRVRQRGRSERTPLRREHHGVREHARIVRVPVQRRIRPSEQLRVRGRGRVQRPGRIAVAVSLARHVHQLAGKLQLQVRGRLRGRRLYVQT